MRELSRAQRQTTDNYLSLLVSNDLFSQPDTKFSMKTITRGFLRSGMRADYSYRELRNNSVVSLCHAVDRFDVGVVIPNARLYIPTLNALENSIGK